MPCLDRGLDLGEELLGTVPNLRIIPLVPSAGRRSKLRNQSLFLREYRFYLKVIQRSTDLSRRWRLLKTISWISEASYEVSSLMAVRLVGYRFALFVVLGDNSGLPQQPWVLAYWRTDQERSISQQRILQMGLSGFTRLSSERSWFRKKRICICARSGTMSAN